MLGRYWPIAFRRILHVTVFIIPLIVVAESNVVFGGPVGPLVLELNASQGLVGNSLLSPDRLQG